MEATSKVCRLMSLCKHSRNSDELLSSVVIYVENDLVKQKGSEAIEVLQSKLYNLDYLEDPNRATDFEYRKKVSANVTWSKA